MISAFKSHLKTTFPFVGKAKLLVACSGGLDSVALVHLLHNLNYDIAIAHCNFNLRERESDEDALFVEQLASDLNVTFHMEGFQTKRYAKEEGVSTQMAARDLRYAW
ncbi:MAG: ATP-binding protein, partial [Marinirhabdus sp.]|nr:ATP-binding protein [Marinirhabdus sp.]